MRVLVSLSQIWDGSPQCRKGLFETILLCTVCVFFAFFNLVAHEWYGHLFFRAQGVWQLAVDFFRVSLSLHIDLNFIWASCLLCISSALLSIWSWFSVLAFWFQSCSGFMCPGKGEMLHAKSISSICWLDLSGAKLSYLFLLPLSRLFSDPGQLSGETDMNLRAWSSTCAHFRSRALFLHLFSCCYLFFLFLGRFHHHPLGFDLQWIDRKQVRCFLFIFCAVHRNDWVIDNIEWNTWTNLSWYDI